jgi:hypothetical protein
MPATSSGYVFRVRALTPDGASGWSAWSNWLDR